MPAVVEADDLGLYVLKFRSAGQGVRALIAEILSGGIARTLGLPVPEIVLATLDPNWRAPGPDHRDPGPDPCQRWPERGAGLPLRRGELRPRRGRGHGRLRLAPSTWFDTLVSNVDRTARNTNLLVWHRRLADRPRRQPHLSPRLERHGGRPGQAFAPHRRTRAAAARRRPGAGGCRAGRAAVPRRAAGHRGRGAAGLLDQAGACRPRPMSIISRPAWPTAAAGCKGGDRCARLSCTTTPSCAWCRAWSARNSSTRA